MNGWRLTLEGRGFDNCECLNFDNEFISTLTMPSCIYPITELPARTSIVIIALCSAW
jgi:hypothetical protein